MLTLNPPHVNDAFSPHSMKDVVRVLCGTKSEVSICQIVFKLMALYDRYGSGHEHGNDLAIPMTHNSMSLRHA